MLAFCLIVDKVHECVTAVTIPLLPTATPAYLYGIVGVVVALVVTFMIDCWSHYLLLLQEEQSCDYEGWCRWKQLVYGVATCIYAIAQWNLYSVTLMYFRSTV